MNSRERVLAAIKHVESDRVPMNIWMFRKDTSEKVRKRYGSMDRFYDRFNIDVHMTITPPPCRTNPEYLEEKMNMEPEDLRPEHWLDPDDPMIYEGAEELIKKYGKDKAIFTHVWGVVESLYGFFGIEKTLVFMGTEPEWAMELFEKVAEFSGKVVKNLLGMGADVIHITGDVGSNRTMLFSPDMWRQMVAPFDKKIIEPALNRKVPVSLHSCGYCMPVIPDWIEMGVGVLHPIQESAGMDLFEVKNKFGDKITIHGGLDLRVLSRLKPGDVDDYVKPRMEALKKGGGFIFNTAHTVQMDTSLDVLELSYDAAMKYGKY